MPDIYTAPEEIKETEVTKETTVIEPPIEQKGGSLSAYLLRPDHVRFDTQAEQEQIILLLRKHWVTNLSWLLVTFILVVSPSLIFPFLMLRVDLPIFPANLLLVLTILWYLFTFGFAFVNFITWYFNVYIVTNERVIDVDFYQLLYKKLASTRISRVQDVTYKLGGVIRSLFNFGDVFIQTAGTEENFSFEAVPHPETVVRQLSDLMEKTEGVPV